MEVFLRRDGERGVRACRSFEEREFVMEFEGNPLNEEENTIIAEAENEKEGHCVYTLNL